MSSFHILLLQLPASHQAILAALTCEKMLPAIVKFDEQETAHGQALFSQVIAALFDFGLGRPLASTEYQRLQEQLEVFWPDLDKSTNPGASYVFDACTAPGEALNFVQWGDAQHVVNCLTAATDTVDMYVQDTQELELTPAELNAFIAATSVMKQEVRRQQLLVQELTGQPTIHATFITHLQSLSGQQPLVNLAIL